MALVTLSLRDTFDLPLTVPAVLVELQAPISLQVVATNFLGNGEAADVNQSAAARHQCGPR